MMQPVANLDKIEPAGLDICRQGHSAEQPAEVSSHRSLFFDNLLTKLLLRASDSTYA